MERINGQVIDFKRLANKVLLWICCAKRPLRTPELQHALAVDVGESELNEHKLPEIEDMVTVCAGLVTVDEESGIIRLVHYTTQEYFEKTQKSWFPKAEVEITETCVTYLSFSVFGSGVCETSSELGDLLQRNPLYDYAARNWGYHARMVSVEVEHLVRMFLNSEVKVTHSFQALIRSKAHSYAYNIQYPPRKVAGLHLGAYFGLMETMTALLKNEDGLESQDVYEWTPLFYAVVNGQEAMVKLLLEKGAKLNINDRGIFQYSPLLYAVNEGHEGTVKLLLEKGADLEYKEALGYTSLLLAVDKGHEGIAKLLLEKGAELETKSRNGQTPLSYAAEHGEDAVVKILLEKGADPVSKSNRGETPLDYATKFGHEGIMKLLLDRGADPMPELLNRKRKRGQWSRC